MSKRKSTQNSTRINNFPKNKKAVSTSELKKQNKGIQCRECEGFGHIQSECANTLKKKGKSFKTTWSDEESEGSEEEDDHVRAIILHFKSLPRRMFLTVLQQMLQHQKQQTQILTRLQ